MKSSLGFKVRAGPIKWVKYRMALVVESVSVLIQYEHLHIIIYVSLRLRVQNAVPAQPCVGKY